MKYNRLGKTDFLVSEVSLGTWQLGGKWGEAFNEKTAFDILAAGVDQGINFIDTADVYNAGMSEIAIGKFLKTQKTKRIYVATKLGRQLNPHNYDGYNKKNVEKFIDQSLTRLGTDTLDLVQLHCPPTAVYDNAEVFAALDEMRAKGKILNYGVSVEKISEAIKAITYANVATVQIIFNMFRIKPSLKFFAQASHQDVGVIVRVPLASGLLTGKFDKNTKFGVEDHRNFNRNGERFDKGETFSGVDYDKALVAVEELKVIFGQHDLANYALKWILSFEEVSCVIPGASRAEQIIANIKAAEMPELSPEQKKQVKEVYYKHIDSLIGNTWD
jgi:aryl-alcohol dehydrogenase-like predicted oxidoreductase